MSSTDNPLMRPGFGLPIDFEFARRDVNRFAHGVNDFHADRLVVREIAMLQLMDALTDKPSWQRKIFDDTIVEKWRKEALTQRLISQQAWDWCLKELRDKAEFHAQQGFVTTLHQQAPCLKSDTLITSELQEELLSGVEPLLNVEASKRDWHPNSDEKVLNLVHPSLHCLVYGKTRVLEDKQVGLTNCIDYCGQGVATPANETVNQSKRDMARSGGAYYRRGTGQQLRFSNRYAWLPSQVKFKESSGTEVEITSYINNLHPVDHRDLYQTIEKIVSKAIPMWNACLVKGWHARAAERIKVEGAEASPAEMPEWTQEMLEQYPEPGSEGYANWLPKVREYLSLPDDPDHTDREWDAEFLNGRWEGIRGLYEAVSWKHPRIQSIAHPEPGQNKTYEQWKAECDPSKHLSRYQYGNLPVKLEDDFRKFGLQVITKLASIELTPEKPDYAGGSWHLEGLLNEHIVGTAIYYYSTDNTTPSRLTFRVEAVLDDMGLSYEQENHRPLATVFGTKSLRDEPAVQNIGSVSTPENRLLVFPNTLQHRVEPFSLEDKTKPGHRRFLVLWLVDPHYRVLSTANVPPQQHEWWARETVEPLLKAKEMPPEMDDLVRDATAGFQMSLEEAREHRLELMKERTNHMPTVESGFDTYNFCEH